MNAADRETIRNTIDAHARARVEQDAVARGCARCGCHLDNHTQGCKRCWERHRQRRRWKNDPHYRAVSNAGRKARKEMAA